MVTCYEEKLADWYANNTEVRATLDGNSYPGMSPWQLKMLMEWAANDPVSRKEEERNNAVFGIQNNRNPFIDYPGLEQYIWGSAVAEAFSYDHYRQPTAGVSSPSTTAIAKQSSTYNLKGQRAQQHKLRRGIYVKRGKKYVKR